MNTRPAAVAAALVACLAVPHAASAHPAESAPRASGVDDALSRLIADARGPVHVHRDSRGQVDFVSSSNGRAILTTRGRSTASSAAAALLARYGNAFGIDGGSSRAKIDHQVRSATGGTVVRADQIVDDVPVFGGQVVMSLDEDQGLVSFDAATTDVRHVAAPAVTEDRAAGAAADAIAKADRVPVGKLAVTHLGRRLYDPRLVHVDDPRGVRPVWAFEVSDGYAVRETVLVGTGRGEIALHFNDAPDIRRAICDNDGAQTIDSFSQVPSCTSPVRTEASGFSAVPDVDSAFDNLGAASAAYADLDGIDLSELVGAGAAGTKELQATVRWCFTDDCPFKNAFWNGEQMVFGDGYAGADDVVAHELTHGYVEHTSGLFAFHQSGTLNESLADVIGEIVDHRTGSDDDSAWQIGEDSPDGVIRSLEDPTLYGQPDKMTSDKYQTADVFDDGGGVHQNDGVGNKTAYLISQGGTFNGRTITGIDGGDTGLAKTGRLYLEVIPRLTSGSEYADLGRVLVSTCDELAAAATGGFTASDCATVQTAVQATELALPPTDPAAAAPEVGATCPDHRDLQLLARDDDDTHGFGWMLGSLWQRTPENGSPSYAESGTSSLFAWNPDPDAYGDPSTSSAVSTSLWVPPDQPTFLHFHHAYVLEYAPAFGADPATYFDGAQVIIQAKDGTGGWVTQSSLPWVNGPDKDISTSASPGFGGDSHGYGSSRVDLTSLAGQQIRVVLTISGDEFGSFFGWWVDDIRLYTCTPRTPSAPTNVRVDAGMSSAVVSWGPPTVPGSDPLGYRIYSQGNISLALPGTATSYLYSKPRWDSATTPLHLVATAPVGAAGWVQSPDVTVTVYTTYVTARTSALRIPKGRYFRYSATLSRSPFGFVPVPDRPVQLQARTSRTGPWRTVATHLSHAGQVAWRVRQYRATYYRVVTPGQRDYFGDTTVPQLIRMR